VPAFGVVEALDIVELIRSCSWRVLYVLQPMRSVFSDKKKLSIAALSHTLPDRLIEQTTPLSAISRWNARWCTGCGDHLLEVFDGWTEVALRLTVQPERVFE
jgi:hypothetical protein